MQSRSKTGLSFQLSLKQLDREISKISQILNFGAISLKNNEAFLFPLSLIFSKKKIMLTNKDNYKLVISYDFGTTFSGASYAFTHTKNPEVYDVQKW
jgi:hypothetical protein